MPTSPIIKPITITVQAIKAIYVGPIIFQVINNAGAEVAGVVTKKAKTGPNLAPFVRKVIAIGNDPIQHTGRIVPTQVAIKIDLMESSPMYFCTRFSGTNSLMNPLKRKPSNTGTKSSRIYPTKDWPRQTRCSMGSFYKDEKLLDKIIYKKTMGRKTEKVVPSPILLVTAILP